jgi:cobyric acid synthase
MILVKVTAESAEESYTFTSICYGDKLSAMAKMTAYPAVLVGRAILGGHFAKGVGTYENLVREEQTTSKFILDGLRARGINLNESIGSRI